MTKAEKIVKFIKKNNPRRKELVKFIVVNLNKKLTAKQWDALPSTDSTHAYYATNISKWKRQGNVKVDPKTKRYSMTKYYNGKLYGITQKVQTEMLEGRATHWQALAKNTNLSNDILIKQNRELRRKLKEIQDILI